MEVGRAPPLGGEAGTGGRRWQGLKQEACMAHEGVSRRTLESWATQKAIHRQAIMGETEKTGPVRQGEQPRVTASVTGRKHQGA